MRYDNIFIKLGFAVLCLSFPAFQSPAQSPQRNGTINDVKGMSWEQILEDKPFEFRPQYTINLLTQPVHSPSWIYVNPSMAVSRRYVPTGLTNNVEKTEAAHHQLDMVLQFAFDEPAFMPDFNMVRLHLADNRYPVATAEFFTNDIYYTIEYSVCRLEGFQTLLCARINVKNEGYTDKVANVRAKLGYYHEDEFFEYHYIPFYWDNTKWRPYDLISMDGDKILKEGKEIGQVVPETMDVSWEESKKYTDKDYEDVLYPQVWYGSGYALKPYRLYDIQDVIHATKPIKPGESVHFSIKLIVDEEQATSNDISAMESLSPQQIRDNALTGYKKEVEGSEYTQMDFPHENWDDKFTALQICIKQMLITYPGWTYYQTEQGGSSERFGMWTFEAVQMLRPMLRLGHFDDVRKGLEFIFSLQDAGCPPVGRFTTTEGSIGTTGPRWANTTGMALILASEYYGRSGDKEFLDKYLPQIIKAIHWITGEIKATRKLNPDGSRPLTYGIMPYAVGCDGDTGFCLSDTDVFTFYGLSKAVEMLESINHPEAAEIRKELEQYHEDLLYTINHLRQPDGNILRMVPVEGENQQIQPKFETSDCMITIGYTGIMDPQDPAFQGLQKYFENKFSDVNGFMGFMDREISYTNQGEHNWQQIYLKLGDWKKAFVVTRAALKYGMSQDAFQTAERISKTNPAFAPWQPNGSGSGRVLDMMMNSFYYESTRDTSIVLGAIPFQWIDETRNIALKGLYTLNGRVDVTISPAKEDGTYSLNITTDGQLPRTLIIPEYLNPKAKSKSVSKSNGSIFTIRDGSKEARFILHR